MPSYAACTSCGRRCQWSMASAPGGITCRECATAVCIGCGAEFHGRTWSAFCSPACGRVFLAGELAAVMHGRAAA